ncbi:MAG: VCBS repeat-containing protein, partial [Chloroflexi bacterium]|nr:VCBS repeat-containing protein [Chloroflexota bacterium]
MFTPQMLKRMTLLGTLMIAITLLASAESVYALNAITPLFTRQLGGGNAGYVRHSSPMLADLNGDGTLEIIVGTLQAQEIASAPYLSVLNSNGTVLWERQVEGHINSTPAVGDINNDGFPEIVVGLGAENEPQLSGGVVAYDRNGNRLWKVTTLDRIGGAGDVPNGLADGVFASPSIADMNNDGIPEVIFGSWDMRMYVVRGTDGVALSGSGSTPYNYWPAEMLDTIWSSPAIADLNGDGKREIIFGGDISYNPAAGTQNGGLLRVFNHNTVDGPKPFPGFNTLYGTICPGGACPTDIGHYGKYVDQTLHSSPAIGDINNDGKLEIVIGSGRAFDPLTYGKWVKVYDNQGTLLRTLTTDGVVFGSPALADINGDGYLDIIAGTERLNQANPPPG